MSVADRRGGRSGPELVLRPTPLLSSPGPDFDSDAPGCPQFHFMPRFVRFLPGKTRVLTQTPVRRVQTSPRCCCSSTSGHVVALQHRCSLGPRFVVTAVPPTFPSIKKPISLLSPPPLLQFSLLQTLMLPLLQKHSTKKPKKTPKTGSRSGAAMRPVKSLAADAAQTLIYSTFTLLIPGPCPICP